MLTSDFVNSSFLTEIEYTGSSKNVWNLWAIHNWYENDSTELLYIQGVSSSFRVANFRNSSEKYFNTMVFHNKKSIESFQGDKFEMGTNIIFYNSFYIYIYNLNIFELLKTASYFWSCSNSRYRSVLEKRGKM